MSRVVDGRCGICRARRRARFPAEQAELAEVALQRRARRRLNADGEQRAEMGWVGLADRGVRHTRRGQISFEGQQPGAGCAKHNGTRSARQVRREARAFAGRVDHLRSDGAARQIVPNDYVVIKGRALDRAVIWRGSNLRGTNVGVNASWGVKGRAPIRERQAGLE